MASICDIGADPLVNIFSRIPITCLGAVRCTCKSWNSLSKELIVGEAAAARQQFVGFMSIANKLCSVRFDVRGVGTEDEVVEQSVKPVALFDHVEISNMFLVDGLVLLVTKDSPNLILWNPYLQQQRLIEPSRNFDKPMDRSQIAFGYDNNGNYKIFRVRSKMGNENEVYDLSSNMWTVLDVTLDWGDWDIDFFDRKVTLKGNCYFFASKFVDDDQEDDQEEGQCESCLVCFDFTRVNFGEPLDIPFRFDYVEDESIVALSCVSEERLAILHQPNVSHDFFKIWITNKIDPNAVSWNLFFTVNTAPQIPLQIWPDASFFIDEKKKVAVVLDFYWTPPCKLTPTAHIIRQEINTEYGCFKSVTIGDDAMNWHTRSEAPVVSPYRPSLLQIKLKHKRKRKRQEKTHV